MKNSWNPFFALANTRSKIDETVERRSNVLMKELSEDELYEIQNSIVYSLENKCEVTITYYKNSRFVDICGIVSKVDTYNKCIKIEESSIKFDCIVKAKLL